MSEHSSAPVLGQNFYPIWSRNTFQPSSIPVLDWAEIKDNPDSLIMPATRKSSA